MQSRISGWIEVLNILYSCQMKQHFSYFLHIFYSKYSFGHLLNTTLSFNSRLWLTGMAVVIEYLVISTAAIPLQLNRCKNLIRGLFSALHRSWTYRLFGCISCQNHFVFCFWAFVSIICRNIIHFHWMDRGSICFTQITIQFIF